MADEFRKSHHLTRDRKSGANLGGGFWLVRGFGLARRLQQDRYSRTHRFPVDTLAYVHIDSAILDEAVVSELFFFPSH